MEAIAAWPLLLSAVGRSVQHAVQRVLCTSPPLGAIEHLQALIANVCAVLAHVSRTVEQLVPNGRWRAFIDYVVHRITGCIVSATPPPASLASG